MNSRIYLANLYHVRTAPKRHSFRYPMLLFIFDLDELDGLAEKIPIFSHNRFNILAFHDRDYVLGKAGDVRTSILNFLKQSGRKDPIGKIELMTGVRYWNRLFNPASFYYCYAPEGDLKMIVTEVSNPWGERHFYILDHPLDMKPGYIAHYRHDVEFFISPFMKSEGEYEFFFSGTRGDVQVRIDVFRNNEKFFVAGLTGKTRDFTNKNLFRVLIRHPLAAGMTFPLIVWQALLLLIRRFPLVRKPEPSHFHSYRLAPPSFSEKICMSKICRLFKVLEKGELEIVFPDKSRQVFRGGIQGRSVRLHVFSYRFFKRLVAAGDIGFGESYMQGEWDSEDVTELLSFFVDNQESIDRALVHQPKIADWINRFQHTLRTNTLRGSKKNISAHYDLSNVFYEKFLDPSMTYSCGIFESNDATLEEAQKKKLKRIAAKAELKSGESVLEIGCGWGSFAVMAAGEYGCRVHGITLSAEQRKRALERIREKDLSGRVRIELQDYREVKEKFDKIVSIEMLEAVGHRYFDRFFESCAQSLKPGGLMVLQVITIPHHRYEAYRKRSDWIQKHIFPGGLLPSYEVLEETIVKDRHWKIESVDPIGFHYARTLRLWRENFIRREPEIEALGFDEVFRRKWKYYFSYCEAGFETRTLDVLQIKLKRDGNDLKSKGGNKC